jgi:short-subunit dehydrogenase
MNIIVTGGSGGIGKQIALHLAGDTGNNLLITGRNRVAMEKISDSAANKNIRYLISDFGKGFAAATFRRDVESIFDSVDILINNAGNLHNRSFLDTSVEEAREMMEVNFFTPMSIIKAIFPLISEGAHIVNIASMGGFQGSVKFPGLSWYSASKAALACISECLAVEFRESKICVNCLALGSVRTEMLESAFPGYKAPVSAEEMGKMIGDFALNGSGYFNGRIIPVALTTP